MRASAPGKLVAELDARVEALRRARDIVRDLSLRIMRGDRLALLGPNGAGKSTLLKLILGQLAPDTGTVRLGTRLDVAYFDQLREALDPERTLVADDQPRLGVDRNGRRAQARAVVSRRFPVSAAARATRR